MKVKTAIFFKKIPPIYIMSKWEPGPSLKLRLDDCKGKAVLFCHSSHCDIIKKKESH